MAQVTRADIIKLYGVILGRTPDVQGLAYWEGQAKSMTLDKMAELFFGSKEFKEMTKDLKPDAFAKEVEKLKAGLKQDSPEMNARVAFVEALMEKDKSLLNTLVANRAYEKVSGGANVNAIVADTLANASVGFDIATLYVTILGRLPDAGGYAWYKNKMEKEGWTLDRIAKDFLKSSEFKKVYNAPEDFVKALEKNADLYLGKGELAALLKVATEKSGGDFVRFLNKSFNSFKDKVALASTLLENGKSDEKAKQLFDEVLKKTKTANEVKAELGMVADESGDTHGDSETPTVTIAQADLANTAATNLKIADSAAHIQGALATLVANKEKVASIKVSDNHKLTIADKDRFTALEEKLSVADKIEITGLGTDDIAIATSPKVDSFTMNGGARLTATVDQVKAITPKAPDNSIRVVDSATKIAGDVQTLTSVKINAIEITGTEALKLTAAQYSLIQSKLTVPPSVSVSLYDVSALDNEASANNDTFVIKNDATDVGITSFTATDKVNLSKVFDATDFEPSVIESGMDNPIAADKAYFVKKTDLTNAFDAASTGGANDFDDLFGSGKLLADTSLGENKSALIVVQVANDTVQVYKIAGTNNPIANTKVAKVATITGAFDPNLKNNFVLENAGEAPAPIPGIDTPVEISAEAGGFYKLFGDSKPLVKLNGIDGEATKLFKKLDAFYSGANAESATPLAAGNLPVKEVKVGDSHYVFATVQSETPDVVKAWGDAAILAIVDEDATLAKGGLTYKFDASHKVKEVEKDGAAIAGADIDSLSDVLAGKFAANGIAFAAGINNYTFTTENLAKMATLVGAGANPFEDDVIAKVAGGATITAENFKKLNGKIKATVTTLKATDLAAGDVAIAKNGNVDSFTMDSGAKLTVAAADVEALKTKAGAATDVFAVVDTAASIKNALDNLVTNVDKVASINASDDGSEIEMTKTQFTALEDKLDAGDTIKVTGLAAGDLAIAENAKVDSFTIFEANASTLNDEALTNLVAIKDKVAEIDTDDNAAITLNVEQFKALGAKFKADEKLTINDATGTLAATRAIDTFKLKADASALAITDFTNGIDKVNIAAVAGVASDVTPATEFEVIATTTADTTVAKDKAYYVDATTLSLADSFNATAAGAEGFGKLFAGSGVAFNTTVADAAKAILAVKTAANKIQLYTIDSAKDGTATNISEGDLTLIGSVTGADIDKTDFTFTA